jgi:hypothetical protein
VLLIVNFLRNILYIIINFFFHLFLWPLYGWPSIYDLNKALHTTLEIEQHERHNNPEVKAAPGEANTFCYGNRVVHPYTFQSLKWLFID